ncbi:ester cyclase [Flavitalea sp.]|nr:ester cyclase [Flavitalea sp.]
MESTILQHQGISVKNVCVQFLLAYQQRNVQKMLSFCDEEGEIYFEPLGDAGKGKIHELGKGLWSALIDSFPDIDNTLDAAVAEDLTTVRCQVVIRGKQQKDFAGITNQGKSFDSDHIFIFKINEENMISRINVSWNHTDFSKQLGQM